MQQSFPVITSHRFSINKNIVLLLYAALLGVGLLNHEPWRDEAHSWLIVHQSHSLLNLLHNIRYEGHPALWYVLLYAIKLLNGSFEMAQLLHWLMAVGVAFLVLTYAPFACFIRVMLVFSYFFFYEYAILTRNYSPGLFLLLLICTQFYRRHQFTGHLLICCLLFLLFQSNVFALLIGLAVYGVILLELIFYRWSTVRTHWQQYAAGASIVGLGLLVCLVTIRTPIDAGFPYPVHGGWTHWNATLSLEMIWNAFVPIPARSPEFWNSNVLELVTNIKVRTLLRATLSIALVSLVVTPLFYSRLALVGWLSVCLTMLFFLISQYFGQLRHHGHFAIGALVFLWIQPSLSDYRGNQSITAFAKFAPLANRLVVAVLALQVLAGAIGYATDLRYSFSGNQLAAAYIEASPIRRWFRAGYPDYSVEGIAASLPQNRMYYPSNGQLGGFLRWTKARHLCTLPQIIDSVRQKNQSPSLIILNHLVPTDTARLLHLTLLKQFRNNIQFDENYFLYRYDRRP